jgi:hypothetical protein
MQFDQENKPLEQVRELGSAQPAAPGQEEAPVDTFGSRLWTIFGSPAKAIEGIRRRPLWVAAGLIVAVVVGLFAATTKQIAGPERMDLMKDSRIMQMMPADKFQEAYDKELNPTVAGRISTGIGAAASIWIGLFIGGLIYLLFGKLAGGTGTLKQVMGVVFWSALISVALGSLVKLPLVFAKKSVMDVNIGLGALGGDNPLSWGHQLLSIFDVFVLWALVVMILGFQKIHGFTRGKAATVTILPWLLMNLILIGIGRAFM